MNSNAIVPGQLEPATSRERPKRDGPDALDTRASIVAGWHAFRVRWAWLIAGQLALLTGLMLVLGHGSALSHLVSASVFRDRGAQDALTGLTLLGLIASVLLWSEAWVGLAWLALRAVRGKAMSMPDWRTGLRRLPAIVGGRLVTALSLLFIPGTVVNVAILLRGAWAIGDLMPRTADPLWPWVLGLSVLAAGWGMLWLAGGWALLAYVVSSVILWPFALVDGRPARDAWRLATGQRWPLTGLCIALGLLNLLGLLAFGVGILVTGAISAAVLAAAYEQLAFGPATAMHGAEDLAAEPPAAGERLASSKVASRSLLRWVLDAWLVMWVAYLAAVTPAIALSRPLVDAIKLQRSADLRLATLFLMVGLLVGVLALVITYRRLAQTPGKRLAGTGWGPLTWLVAPLAVLGLVVGTAMATGWAAALVGTWQEHLAR